MEAKPQLQQSTQDEQIRAALVSADLIEYRPHFAGSFQAQRIAPEAREPV